MVVSEAEREGTETLAADVVENDARIHGIPVAFASNGAPTGSSMISPVGADASGLMRNPANGKAYYGRHDVHASPADDAERVFFDALRAVRDHRRNICVVVATHKRYPMPSDEAYLPMQVGKAVHSELDLGYACDDTGDNISTLNPYYSELTAMYWLWKNCNDDYKGLVQYRRLFSGRGLAFSRGRHTRAASKDDLFAMLDSSDADIILPKRRRYVIESVYSHYAHTLDASQLDAARDVLEQIHPEYVQAFDRRMRSTSAHIFNMFVMRGELFDEYCSWLFPILGELVRRIPPQGYDPFGARYPGRVSEFLLDVWLDVNGYTYHEAKVYSPEPVRWAKKGMAFLSAKFLGRKYAASF